MPKLSDLTCRNASSGMYWDEGLPGFGLRVGKSAKTFILLNSGSRESIGRYPAVSLSEARKTAQQRLLRRSLTPAQVGGQTTFGDAVERFLAHSAGKHRTTTTEYYGFGLNHFRFGRLSEITRQQIVAANPPPYALVSLKVFFSWAVKSGLTDTDPTFRMPSNSRYTPRERVLIPTEILSLLQELRTAPDTFKRICLLLLLTGQRRNEIARLEWSWITGDTITIPSHVAKNHRAHTFPIGQMVKDVLSNIPNVNQYVFPAARDHVKGKPATVFNGWSKAKVKLDRELSLPKWNLHDLRRTFSSNLAALGIPIHVTEKLLNHVSGTISGVAAVYNRHAYLAEMRDAIQKWETYLQNLTTA